MCRSHGEGGRRCPADRAPKSAEFKTKDAARKRAERAAKRGDLGVSTSPTPTALMAANPDLYAIGNFRDAMQEGHLVRARNSIGEGYWLEERAGELLGVSQTSEEDVIRKRCRDTAAELKDYLATSDTLEGLDADRLAALTEEWERVYTTQEAYGKQFDARVKEAEAEAEARMARGEHPLPVPSAKVLDDLYAELGIDVDAELHPSSDRRYRTSEVTHAADALRKHYEVASKIEALDAPKAVAKREKLGKEVAAAWKAYKAGDPAAAFHPDERFHRYLAEHHPDLDVVAAGQLGEVTRKALASNARDQKRPRPRTGVSSAFGGSGSAASFVRADRVAEVMRAHQASWTPAEYVSGVGERDRGQAVDVSEKAYVYGGKLYHLVHFADMGRDAPANASYALTEAVAKYRHAQANGFSD